MSHQIETTHSTQPVSPVVLQLDHPMQMPVTTLKIRLSHRKQHAVLLAEQPQTLADKNAKLTDSLNHYLFW